MAESNEKTYEQTTVLEHSGLKYRYIRRDAAVSGEGNDVERALNKFAAFGYSLVGQCVIEGKLYMTLARGLTQDEIRAAVEAHNASVVK